MSDSKNIEISICTYQNDNFDIIFRDTDTGEEITFSGNQKLSEEEFVLANKIAPACVYSNYKRT